MTYEEYIQSQRREEAKYFFSDSTKLELDKKNGKIRWVHHLTDDVVIIETPYVRYWPKQEQYVLLVGHQKVVYLKDWQVLPIRHNDEKIHAVKLNREHFKIYNIGFVYEDGTFPDEVSFDYFVEQAKEQDKSNKWFSLGWFL